MQAANDLLPELEAGIIAGISFEVPPFALETSATAIASRCCPSKLLAAARYKAAQK